MRLQLMQKKWNYMNKMIIKLQKDILFLMEIDVIFKFLVLFL